MAKTKDFIDKNGRMIIGNEKKTNFWDDVWTHDQELSDLPQFKKVRLILIRRCGKVV